MLETVIEEKDKASKKKKKRRTIKDFDADEQEALMYEALQRAFSKMLQEAEINYILNVLKKKDPETGNDILKITVQKEYYQKAKKTLEILMARLGLTPVYQNLVYRYEKTLSKNFDETLVKVLYRCLSGITSIQKCQKIFSMNEKRLMILEQFKESIIKED